MSSSSPADTKSQKRPATSSSEEQASKKERKAMPDDTKAPEQKISINNDTNKDTKMSVDNQANAVKPSKDESDEKCPANDDREKNVLDKLRDADKLLFHSTFDRLGYFRYLVDFKSLVTKESAPQLIAFLDSFGYFPNSLKESLMQLHSSTTLTSDLKNVITN